MRSAVVWEAESHARPDESQSLLAPVTMKDVAATIIAGCGCEIRSVTKSQSPNQSAAAVASLISGASP